MEHVPTLCIFIEFFEIVLQQFGLSLFCSVLFTSKTQSLCSFVGCGGRAAGMAGYLSAFLDYLFPDSNVSIVRAERVCNIIRNFSTNRQFSVLSHVFVSSCSSMLGASYMTKRADRLSAETIMFDNKT